MKRPRSQFSRGRWLTLLALSACVAASGKGKESLGVRLPTLERILPLGGSPGSAVAVSLLGDMLSNAEGLEFDCRDLTFVLSGANAGTLDGTIRIAPDAAPGPHFFRARTKDGHTNALMFNVGQFPAVIEKEPNESVAGAQTVALPCEIYGSMGKEDLDFYAFEAQAGERWLFEVRAAQFGSTFESQLYLRDETGRELRFNDDREDFDVNSAIEHTFAKKGKYLLQVDVFRNVRSWEFTKNSGYVLRVSKLPRVVAISPLGGRPGAMVRLHIAGSALEATRRVILTPTRRAEVSTMSVPWTFPVRFVEDFATRRATPTLAAPVSKAGSRGVDVEFRAPSEPPGLWSVQVEGPSGLSDPRFFEVAPDLEVSEAEPNDTRDNAQPLRFDGKPLVVNGRLEPRRAADLIDDIDYYAVDGRKGVALHFYTTAYQLLAPRIDTVVRVLDASGKRVAESDDLTAGRGFLMGSVDSSVFYVPERDEKLTVAVFDRVGRAGPDLDYRLHVRAEPPGFQLVASPQLGLRSVWYSNFTAPRGGEANILVSLFRLPPRSYSDDPVAAALAPPPGAGFKGEVRVWVEGLPEGAVASPQTFRADEITEPGGDGVTMAIPERLVAVRIPATVAPGTYPFRVVGESVDQPGLRAGGVSLDSIGGFLGAWNYFQRPGAETTLTVVEPGGLTLEFDAERVAVPQAGSTELVLTNYRPADAARARVRLTNAPAGLRHDVAVTESGHLRVRLHAAEELPLKTLEGVYVEVETGSRTLSTRPFSIAVLARERERLTGRQSSEGKR